MTPREEHAALTTLLRTVRDAIDQYLQVVGEAPASTVSEAAPVARPATDDTNAAAFEQTRRAILAKMIEKTGYPEEMLDLDLDLEADLGIDTVKQVAVYGAAREQLGIALDPAFKLRDHNTLRKVITAMAKRLPSGS